MLLTACSQTSKNTPRSMYPKLSTKPREAHRAQTPDFLLPFRRQLLEDSSSLFFYRANSQNVFCTFKGAICYTFVASYYFPQSPFIILVDSKILWFSFMWVFYTLSLTLRITQTVFATMGDTILKLSLFRCFQMFLQQLFCIFLLILSCF